MQNYLLNDSIISPLGFDVQSNLNALRRGESALKYHQNDDVFPQGIFAGLIAEEAINAAFEGDPSLYTKLEKLLILAIKQVIDKNDSFDPDHTGLIISTTKGNIDILKNKDFPEERLYLWKMAQIIGSVFNIKSKPVVVSNACISGALAIKTANTLIRAGRFKNVIVAAGDLASEFVLSGFNSFQAISPQPCRPFSKDRQGISLGEAAAAVMIGPSNNCADEKVKFIDAFTANDANHISGPSRTGEGLYKSLNGLLEFQQIRAEEIDFISAHGTATVYNDEMEAIAFNRAGLENIPLNSFKGSYGHTLGTSGLLECILTKHSLLNNELFVSNNFTEIGVSKPLNIIKEYKQRELSLALKTASGFGGCNLAMLLKKEK